MRYFKNFFKVQLFALMMIAAIGGVFAQATYLANEQFSAVLPQGWSVQPASTSTAPTWASNTSLATSGSYSMHGYVPYSTGDTIELITPYYDCSNYRYVMLKFSHICKVLQSDLCQVMYQEQGIGQYYKWRPIPYDAYKGGSPTYRVTQAFDHTTYSEWQSADTFAAAANSWWKEETFDMSDYASYTIVRYKFIIKKGSYFGSFIADGWYIDDFQVLASNYEIKPPKVEILSRFSDTVYTTGPYEIKAKVATRTAAPIVRPYLHYTTLYNNVTKSDSILMEDYDGGDSIWTATIPQHLFGTTISYYIHGFDSVGNNARDAGGFTSKYMAGGAVILTGDSVQYGNATSGGNCSYPFMLAGASPNWVRMLYMSDMVKPDKSGGFIGAMSFYNSYSYYLTHKNVKPHL